MEVRLRVRADVDDEALARLHALAFDEPYRPIAWRSRLQRHSLTWITAYDEDDGLVGFVNVAWDGGRHAFVLDTVVDPHRRHIGLGAALVQRAAAEAAAAGCTWTSRSTCAGSTSTPAVSHPPPPACAPSIADAGR